MRIRSTRPHFWRSDRIASVSWDARLVLKGLESYADDNGVGKDDLELILGDLFQRDVIREPSRTVARVSEAISELHRAGLIWRYEAEGTRLLYISFWEEVQRIDKAQAGRFPRPDGTFNYKDSSIRESSMTAREPSRNVAPGVVEEGSSGGGEKEVKDLRDPDGSSDVDALAHITEEDFPNDFTPIYSQAFEEWWVHYPRKAGKRKAFSAWKNARKRTSPEQLIAGAQRYADDPNREETYTKYPEGWLNSDGWLDEPLPARRSGPRYQNGQPMQGADLRAAENAHIANLFNNPKAIGQ